MNQIELHNKIDKLIKDGIAVEGFNIEKFNEIVKINNDSQQYFFAKADKKWLNWLRESGFLTKLEEEIDPSGSARYRFPELNYLIRMADELPDLVTDIILKTSVPEKNFNPDIISGFLWICSNNLPAMQIAKLADKIKNEEWVQKMQKFNSWGFDYEKIFQKLIDANDYKSFLTIAAAVLAIKIREEMISQKEGPFYNDNPFYYRDLWQTRVFTFLIKVDNDNLDNTLNLTLEVLKKIIQNGEEKSDSIFDFEEPFYLGDQNVFDLKIEEDRGLSYRDDINNLVAIVKQLIERIPKDKIQEVYFGKIKTLPFSQTTWKLQLFVATSNQDVLGGELNNLFFKLFADNGYPYLFWGAEYKEALKKGFNVIQDKRVYIDKVLNYFSQEQEDKKEEGWRKRDGLIILSCIYNDLSLVDKTTAKEKLGKEVKSDYKQDPNIGKMVSGFVKNDSPINIESFGKLSIVDIVAKLKSEWTPEELEKLDGGRDFLNPINTEGVGEILRLDINKRPAEYLDSASAFFDIEINKHYFYSYFQGIYDVIKNNKYPGGTTVGNLLELIEKILSVPITPEDIKSSRKSGGFEWVASWDSVYNTIADVVKELLKEDYDPYIDFVENRGKFLLIIKKLIGYEFDPDKEDNIRENGGDPYTTAINSVRGRAFECLINFIYLDGKGLEKAEIKINTDVFALYKDLVTTEDTYAIRFMIGRYLSSFYYRNKIATIELLPDIFAEDSSKYDLYLATLEGYFSANLYVEMFDDQNFVAIYKKAIGLDPLTFTKRKYFRELDDGLAGHLALAYIYFDGFDSKSKLFKLFWNSSKVKSQKEFISFIGRHVISQDNAKEFINVHKIKLQKLKDFWDLILNNPDLNQEIYSAFGFWMNDKGGVFDNMKWLSEHILSTLKKSGGLIDWDYGLTKVLPEIAVVEPELAFNILQAFLLPNVKSQHAMIYVDDYKKVFEVVYEKLEAAGKTEIENLISELMKSGGQPFWILENIVNKF